MPAQTSNRKNIALLALTLGVVMLGFGVVVPVYPFYIQSLGASGRELGLLIAVSPLLQMFCSPLWGNLSDRIGRKPVLFAGLLGYGLSMLLFGLATQLWMLYVIRALGGILSAATLPTTYAYISDSTTENDRSGAMGILGAATGLGMILGPVLGGWLASDSLATPFFITAGVCALTLLLIVVLLPESLPVEARRRHASLNARWAQVSGWRRTLCSPLGVLMFLTFLVSFALANFQGVFGLYALHKYGYGTEEVGAILTAIALVSTVAQGALAGPLTKRWGEATLVKGTLLISAASFVLMVLAASFPAVLLTSGLFALPNALLRPATASLTSRHAANSQGAIMGLSNSFMSLGRIVGPVWAGFVFDLNADLPYLTGAAIMLVGFAISLVWLANQPGQVAAAAK